MITCCYKAVRRIHKGEISKHVRGLNTLDFRSITWRVVKMDIKIDPSIMKEEVIVIAADASGIRVANRGELLRRKWYKGIHQDAYSCG